MKYDSLPVAEICVLVFPAPNWDSVGVLSEEVCCFVSGACRCQLCTAGAIGECRCCLAQGWVSGCVQAWGELHLAAGSVIVGVAEVHVVASAERWDGLGRAGTGRLFDAWYA